MNDRELIHAALQWHAANTRRMEVGTEKRRLDKAIKAAGDSADAWRLRSLEGRAARQLTELKRKELAALRALAKACSRQRGHLNLADVVLDGETRLLPCSE